MHLQQDAHPYILFQMIVEHKGDWVKEDDLQKLQRTLAVSQEWKLQ